MQIMITIHKKIMLALGLLALANVAVAAPISLVGNHFSVAYDDPAGIYNQGFMAGSQDTVYFQPSAFTALSAGNQVNKSGSLQLTFTIDPGYTLAGLMLTERGNYFLRGGGAVNVIASVQQPNAASALLDLEPGSPLVSVGGSTSWAMTGAVSLAGLGAPQILTITLDNNLFASSAGTGLGFVQKTYTGIQVVTRQASVPEPSSVALVLIGMVAAGLAGRRRASVTSWPA
jgi:hypothetical protein